MNSTFTAKNLKAYPAGFSQRPHVRGVSGLALKCQPSANQALKNVGLIGKRRQWKKVHAAAADVPDLKPGTEVHEDDRSPIGVMIITSDAASVFGPPWQEVMEHIGQKLKWSNDQMSPVVALSMDVDQLLQIRPDVMLFVGVQDAAIEVSFLEALKTKYRAPVVLSFDNESSHLDEWISLKGFNPTALSLMEQLCLLIPWSPFKKYVAVYEAVQKVWSRRSSDDIVYLIQFVAHQFVRPLPEMADLDPDFEAVKCISKNCREEVLQCLLDPQCRKALDCINSCGINDQVCSYRCIVSYESQLLERFSLCILQKHNCLRRTASIPMLPEVPPLATFRGEPLTFGVAEEIFIGHLGEVPWSWKVAFGKNPAYDFFPCQFQLFYRGKSRGSMWYDPVFKVITLEGKAVWRRRHYRVRRADRPGSFFFSVLDNGVTSSEFWRIVDVSEDLLWALFYYAGAAAAAGISYTGAVLGTFDGKPPPETEMPRIEAALERCGIKMWEISNVDYSACENPPLDIPEQFRRDS